MRGLVEEKVPEGREQKRSESSPLAASVLHVLLLQKPREKGLRQILRILGVVSLTADVRVERIPIRFAERRKRLARL